MVGNSALKGETSKRLADFFPGGTSVAGSLSKQGLAARGQNTSADMVNFVCHLDGAKPR